MLKYFKLNLYSLLLIIAFLATFYSINYQLWTSHLFDLLIILPLLFFMILRSQKSAYLLGLQESELSHYMAFERDFSAIIYSFFLGSLLSILTQSDNADIRSLWPLAIYYITIMGFVFAIIYSGAALFLRLHKKYTFIFCAGIIIFLSIEKFLPWTLQIGSFGTFDTFWTVMILLLGFHLLVCLGVRVRRMCLISD